MESPAPRNPPKYSPPSRRCVFCNTLHSEYTYTKHLMMEHSEMIFYCEECNRYTDRKEFLRHMSNHAMEYTNGNKELKYYKNVKIKRPIEGNQNSETNAETRTRSVGTVLATRNQDSKSSDDNDITTPTDSTSVLLDDDASTTSNHMHGTLPVANSESNDTVPRSQYNNTSSPVTRSHNNPVLMSPKTDTTTQGSKTTRHNQENEFSDHSDMEYGFGPLPESVFEAIEDTQDSERTELHSDESNPVPEEQEVKKPQAKKIRTCPICSKVYKASSSYFYHLKYTHKKIKEHECEICGKKFATRASLATHVAIHGGEYRFECKECKKRFRSNAGLYIHEQTHNGIKTWSCKHCQASFRWKTHLSRHMKRHSAEKAHTCPTCGRGFSIRYDLLRHVRTHNAGDFACEKCDVKFAQLRYLKVHMEKKHSTKVARKNK